MNDAKVDVRPLGLVAVGSALLSVALSVTYFLSPLALVAAVVALLLGAVSRSEPTTRGRGNMSIVLAVASIAVSCAMITWI